MRVLFIVHGFVQGVGYRDMVRQAARHTGVYGEVKNLNDGSVQIIVEADPKSIERFEKEISVSMPHGPQVLKIERHAEGTDAFPRSGTHYEKFEVF